MDGKASGTGDKAAVEPGDPQNNAYGLDEYTEDTPMEPWQCVVITHAHAVFETLRVAGQASNSKNCVRFKLLDAGQTLADLEEMVDCVKREC